MKKAFILTSIFMFFIIIIFLFHSKIHWLKSEEEIPKKYKTELIFLAEKTLETKDVPISSLVIYKNEIIGKGYNTVLANLNAGEHAEINAISDAMKLKGINEFNLLNRDSLYLITTFEPCPMCFGAIQMYNVQNVFFMKGKSLMSNISYDIKTVEYFLNRRTLSPASLQDSLFSLHPDYHKQKEK